MKETQLLVTVNVEDKEVMNAYPFNNEVGLIEKMKEIVRTNLESSADCCGVEDVSDFPGYLRSQKIAAGKVLDFAKAESLNQCFEMLIDTCTSKDDLIEMYYRINDEDCFMQVMKLEGIS